MKILLAAFSLFVIFVSSANAETLIVEDIAGRKVQVPLPVKTFVLSEGRYIPLLALLRPRQPVEGLVGMMSPLEWSEPGIQKQLYQKFPEARRIPLFGSRSADSVSVEKIIDLAPDVAIFGMSDHGPGAKSAELIELLEASGTAVIFIDFRADPLKNTLPSIRLLGQLFGAEKKAEAYIAYHKKKQDELIAKAATAQRKPSVFIQVHPGRFDCCWGMADGMMGPFVGVLGGVNIADAAAVGPTSLHTAEFLLETDPDVWIGTASGTRKDYDAGKPPVALGAGMTAAMAATSLKAYLEKPEFKALSAVRNGRAHSIWHHFYNSPFNIVAFEAFAKWMYPKVFIDNDPNRTLAEIYKTFLPFEQEGTFFATHPHE